MPTNCAPLNAGFGVRAMVLWAVVAALLPAAARGELIVDIAHVGFPASDGDIIRTGAWTPVSVDVSLVGEESFEGSLRIAQIDLDGDVVVDEVPVSVRAETGGIARRFLYVPAANPMREHPGARFSVEVLNADGEVLEVVSAGAPTRRVTLPQPPQMVSDDEYVILSIRNGTVGRISDLTQLDQQALYERRPVVAHVSPRDVPELWIGLEMVDAVLWDEAAAADLTPAQLEALLTWVRQGGLLLVCSGGSAGGLAQLPELNRVLPVDLGEASAATSLLNLQRNMLGLRAETGPPPFPGPVTVVQATARPGARVLLREDAPPTDLITRSYVGRGQIVFCGMDTRDVFSGVGQAVRFFQCLLALKPLEQGIEMSPERQSLFKFVASPIAFATSVGAYLLVAFVFSIGYLLLTTLGTWWFLSARGWRHLAWTAFALTTVAASFLSVVAVAGVQGVGMRVHQMSVIDAEAGETYGQGLALIGLKTSSDSRVDVWLPSDPVTEREPEKSKCFLRSLSEGDDPAESRLQFTDQTEYQLSPSTAELDELRVRATLKRLEARWEGPLAGRVAAQLSAQAHSQARTDWRFTTDSYIENHLGVTLRNCYLIHAPMDAADLAKVVPVEERSHETFVYAIGDLPGDGRRMLVAPLCYKPNPGETVPKFMEGRQLYKVQEMWRGAFINLISQVAQGVPMRDDYGLPQEQSALLILSTLGEWDFDARPATMFGMHWSWKRDRLRWLDLRDWLQSDSAVLIGFADDPGPIRLAARRGERAYETLDPERGKAWVMYRIRIPIRKLEGRAPGSADASTGQDAGPEDQ